MSLDKAKIDAFLRELAELSNKHGIIIEGCGCCGSPYLSPMGIGKVKRYETNPRRDWTADLSVVKAP